MKVKQARAVLKNYRLKPNKSEQKLLALLDEYLPGKFIYNGGQILIEGKIPDFVNVNDRKVIIELVGRRDLPKHTKEELEKRQELFSKYGWRTLYIYQDDLKNEDQLLEDIILFTFCGLGKD